MRRPADVLADELDVRLSTIAETCTGATLGVSVYDYLSGGAWCFNGDRWFHAASTIKVAVLIALFDAIDQGRFALNARLHVRNRFFSAADNAPFRIEPSRDADHEVHDARGRTLRLRELAERMIVRSSNLATNLLVDLLGVDGINSSLRALGLQGVEFRRGVEDDRAFESGMSNRVTPNGALAVMRAIVGSPLLSPEASTRMIDLLLAQQFAGVIAPGLPEPVRSQARVAHKTGDISTASHDVGLVFLPGRPPYITGIFVESSGDPRERTAIGIKASTAVYECIAAAGEGARR
ncbi:MAG: class A beta-lactamase-related serine hydrolase [Planctomycetota bacterium]|nr:class A beta-lactamase-related serine hydrolase [Planctomycetota bacterium]